MPYHPNLPTPTTSCDRMALALVLSRWFYDRSTTRIFKLSRISPSDDWSKIPLELPKKINAAEYEIICSGYGLVCFYRRTGFVGGEFVIWNSHTGACQLIPHSDLTCRPCVKKVLYGGSGLGFVSDGFKFVRFMYLFVKNGGPSDVSCHCTVYSSKNNSWEEHQPFPFLFGDEYDIAPRGDGAATCVNGFCYWTTSVDEILSFELSSDRFSTIPYPVDIARDFRPETDASLLELDGSLGLVIRFKLENSLLFSFWVYEGGESSPSRWTRKMNLDVSDAYMINGYTDGYLTKPLWLGKKNNGEYSLLLNGFSSDRRDSLLEYDYRRKELEKIGLAGDDLPTTCKMMLSSYVETNISSFGSEVNTNIIVDRISLLPDDIKLSILSFLSLKEAAASTSLLSKQWSGLWRHTPILNFHFAHHLLPRDKHKYIECVNSVVESYRAPALKELNISFPLNHSVSTKWLEFAFSRGVEVLELNFLGRSPLLVKVFKSTNLKSLSLKCLQVGGNAIGLVLRNCPMLERLIIKHAFLTSDVEVCGGALKYLNIQYCKGGVSIKGYAPNLTHLKIDSGPLIFIDGPPNVDYPKLIWAHPFISFQLTTLEFTLKGSLDKGLPEIPSLRVLIVTYQIQRNSIRPITCLLRALPCLEELEIKHWRSSVEEQLQQEATQMGGVENICHHLRVFKLRWFDVNDRDHMELMECILENCLAFHRIILHIYDADSSSSWTSPACAAAMEYAKLLQSKLPTHIQLVVTFNYRQLL